MFGGDLVLVPVHPREARPEDLHAVHADIAAMCDRILGMDNGQGDKGAAILWPASNDRKLRDIGLRENYLLTLSPLLANLWHPAGELVQAGQQLQFVDNAFFW